jgi:hypothetical protein
MITYQELNEMYDNWLYSMTGEKVIDDHIIEAGKDKKEGIKKIEYLVSLKNKKHFKSTKTAVRIAEKYGSRTVQGVLIPAYIRYLRRIDELNNDDKKLWNPLQLQEEYGVTKGVVGNILKPPKLKVDRRKGDRRKK